MKLNEIRDITSYRSGDEYNPRSPDYDDPMDHVNVEDYMPQMPTVSAIAEQGKDKHGDDYSFKVICRWPRGAQDDHDIEYYISSAFADKFPEYETVWDESQVINGGQAVVEYLQGNTAAANRPEAAQRMNAVLKQIIQDVALKIATAAAEKDADGSRERHRRGPNADSL